MHQDQTTRRKALVVEDEPAISRACQKVLTAEGFDVDVAMNGFIAMKMVNEKTYDLCLSDIKIPGMGGIELFNKLKEHHSDLINTFIFMSGDILGGSTAHFLEEVKKPFLAKPFSPDELRNVLRLY